MTAPSASLPDWYDRRFQLLTAALDVKPAVSAGDTCLITAEARPADVVAGLIAAAGAGRPLWIGPGEPPELVQADARERGFGVYLSTSGTTGTPKTVFHTFDALKPRRLGDGGHGARWLLSYEIASYAGLQVLLTALMQDAALAAPSAGDAAALIECAVQHQVTHISATPTFWRALLLSGRAGALKLASLTLGGEIADQTLLDQLASRFPDASMRHIYASSEAGSVFSVADGHAGFPAAWFDGAPGGIGLRIADGALEVRSATAMEAYIGADLPQSEDGWIRTGDLVEISGDRVFFQGRADAQVKVAGAKVSPEAVERLLCAEPGVADALVRAHANALSGYVLSADVLAAPDTDGPQLLARLQLRLQDLEAPARPRKLRLVDVIDAAGSGKKRRIVGEMR